MRTRCWKNQKGNQNIPRKNYNENTTQNLWDAIKAVLRGKLIQAYLKKQEKHQINDITLHLKQLEKRRTKNPTKSIEGKKS